MATLDEKLSEVRDHLHRDGGTQEFTVREVLSWFGTERRGPDLLWRIQAKFAEHSLVVSPDINSLYIDSPVSFKFLEGETREEVQESSLPEAIVAPFLDPTYRISRLRSANITPVSVKPDTTIGECVSLMLLHDFSQLPVMVNERDVKGVISWESIGKRLSLGLVATTARQAMEPHFELSSDASLLVAIDEIASRQYALIRNPANSICGIVTTADLSMQFKDLAEPYLILGEIENHIRVMISTRFTKDELSEAKDPADATRVISSVSDMTFGEYVRLLEQPLNWKRIGLIIDRAVFINTIETIRSIRNDVMHFDPDGIQPEKLDTLRQFCSMMRDLQHVGAIR